MVQSRVPKKITPEINSGQLTFLYQKPTRVDKASPALQGLLSAFKLPLLSVGKKSSFLLNKHGTSIKNKPP